jgi:hypothetical protein
LLRPSSTSNYKEKQEGGQLHSLRRIDEVAFSVPPRPLLVPVALWVVGSNRVWKTPRIVH